MIIKRVRVENFKRIKDLDIVLSPYDCLVGPNNSGKTTLLQALALFDFCVHLCVARQNGASAEGTLHIKKSNVSPEEFYVLPVANPLDLWHDRRTQDRGKHRHIKVTVDFDSGQEVVADLDLNFNLYHFSMQSQDESQEWLRTLRDFRVAYLPVFSTFLPQEERRTRAVIEDALVRGSVNSVIRNLLLDLKDEKRHGDLVEILQRAFPDLANMSIAFDQTSDRFIAVTYKESGRQKEFDIFASGSGFQQFVYLFGFITLRRPNVILLDEPDVHLHGSLQGTLVSELRNLVYGGRQVLVATHSPDLISRVSPKELMVFTQEQVQRLSVRSEVYDTLDRLGAMSQVELPTAQLHRLVLLLENATDKEVLYTFCETILGPARWCQVERRLAVCFAKGNPRNQDVERLRAQLAQMLPNDGRPLKMFVIADRDYYPDVDTLPAETSPHVMWHTWNRVEIENYLLNVDAIVRLIKEDAAHVELHEYVLNEEFERLIDASRDVANDRLVKGFEEYGRRLEKRWDATTLSRKAREYLLEKWASERLALADAKEIVLPGMNRWLQANGYGSFTNKRLAQVLRKEELPKEIHDVARRLMEFSGSSN